MVKWYCAPVNHSNTRYYLAGFSFDLNHVYAYLFSKSFYYYYGSQSVTQRNDAFTKMQTFMSSNSTIGVGLSIIRKTITFVYENISESYQLNFETDMKILPAIWEANLDNIQDQISINFGKYPFKYYLPVFISYQNYQNTISSCLHNPIFNFDIHILLLYLFIIL